MSQRSYRPGEWFGVVGERAVVALPPTEKARVAALWELVDGGAGFDVTLDALISGGLRDLPAFVLVSTGEGETRVVIRGAARAEFDVGGETVRLAGSEGTTWVERSLTGVERMSVVLQDDAAEPLPSYVVDGGLFRVSRLDEAPVHEGSDEAEAEPAYEWEFPLEDAGALEGGFDETDFDELEGEGDGEPAVDQGEFDEEFDEGFEPAGEEPVSAPEPPIWAPAPPAPPPLHPVPQPPTEAMAAPVEEGPAEGEQIPTGEWEPEDEPALTDPPPGAGVPAPVARLLVSNGDVVDIDRAVVIGRAPESRRSDGDEQPLLVTVPSPHLEISSTHIEVRPGSGADHGSAVVTDLGSTNGTVLVQPGLGPEDLAPGVPVQLLPGALIDLGDGVTIQVTNP